MIKHVCDRCYDEIPGNHQRVYMILKDEKGDFIVDMKLEYELCRNCKEKLKEFLEGEKDGK